MDIREHSYITKYPEAHSILIYFIYKINEDGARQLGIGTRIYTKGDLAKTLQKSNKQFGNDVMQKLSNKWYDIDVDDILTKYLGLSIVKGKTLQE